MSSAEHASNLRRWVVRSRGWISILAITPFAVIAALSMPMIREESIADILLGGVGWACFFAGATFRWWATLYVGGRKEQELAVDGPYSVSRNPLYLGTFLLTMSIAFFVHSLVFAIGLLIATPMYLWITIPWEETKLRERFGERYDAYCQRVPKFLPDFSKYESPPTLQVNVGGLAGEFRMMLRWMWIPLLAEAVAHLRMEAWWPVLIRLP